MTSLRGIARTEFPKSVKAAAFRRCCDAKGVPHCENCNIPLSGPNTIFEHVTPDGLGGEPTLANCKVFCRNCASKKTFAQDNPRMQKADRQLKAGYGIKKPSRFPGSRNSPFKKKLNGRVELRS